MREMRRNAWDSEAWDDNSGLVFYNHEDLGSGVVLAPGATRDLSVVVPAQVATLQQRAGTRFEITAQTRVNTPAAGSPSMNATLYIIVNGTTLPGLGQIYLPANASQQGGSLDHYGVVDLPGTLATVTAQVKNSSGSFNLNVYFTLIKVRRGRPVGM